MCWLKMFLWGSYFVADYCIVSLLCGGCKVLWVVSSCFLPGSNRHFLLGWQTKTIGLLSWRAWFWWFIWREVALFKALAVDIPLWCIFYNSQPWSTRTLKVAYTLPQNRRPPEVCTLIELKYCTKMCMRLLHLPFEIVFLRLTRARRPCGASVRPQRPGSSAAAI